MNDGFYALTAFLVVVTFLYFVVRAERKAQERKQRRLQRQSFGRGLPAGFRRER